ncbi:hypothetical protein RGQ29_009497 [Quercus rubra]|uniref:Uncharacterized protein n=1 Tax=Quercus rubra TaxID=3512 RepID=A0AAN7J4V7_QUERU|nr:hypothetical protein RGQ29_009497 [Quercus rubra]
MAMVIIESIMKNYTCISTAHQVEVLFELIKGLIKDLDGTAADELIRQLQGQYGDIAREEVPNGAMAALAVDKAITRSRWGHSKRGSAKWGYGRAY